MNESLRALIVTPAPPKSLSGNRVTARRWADLLTGLGHRSRILERYDGEPCDVLIALHAAKSATSIDRFRAERPRAPMLVALTGTDLYRDLAGSESTRRSLELATRILALHPAASADLPERLRPRVRVILQSIEPVTGVEQPAPDRFDVAVVGHLRPVKDPFRAAEAVRSLPDDSSVQVVHIGAALSPEMERRAIAEQSSNPRYRWLGALTREETLQRMARSHLLVLSSLVEGGANVVGEAVVHGVPVLASRIAGSVGLLGVDYPGYFETGDTQALAAMIRRAETDAAFYEELRRWCVALAPSFHPDREREAWRSLLGELRFT